MKVKHHSLASGALHSLSLAQDISYTPTTLLPIVVNPYIINVDDESEPILRALARM
jgi:hypothetical protein